MRRFLKFLAWLFGLVLVTIAGFVAHANHLIAKYETETIQARAPGRFVTVEGRQQHFVTVGDVNADPTGAPLMFIHGFIVSGHAELTPWVIDKLGASRALILPDLMGYGFSQREITPGEWSAPKSHARYLAHMLDQLGVDKVDLAGHSYGGALAAQFALDYPDRVRKVVYLNPGLYLPKSRTEYIIDLPLGLGRALTYHFLGNGPFGFPARVCGANPDCGASQPARIKDTTETLRALMRYNRESRVLEDLYADIPKLRTPGLIIWGKDDFFLSFSTAERFARDSKAKLEVLPDASHLPWREKPDEVARWMLDYFAAN